MSKCLNLIWYIKHFLALNCFNEQDNGYFDDFIKKLVLKFPCDVCKPHYEKMVEKIPPNKFKNKKINGVDISRFFWTTHTHNLVNLRLKKKLLSVEEAYEIHNNYNLDIKECDDMIWRIIHTQALLSQSEHSIKSFFWFIKCMIKFLNNNVIGYYLSSKFDKLNSFINKKNNINHGCFYWTFHIHNIKNFKEGKSIKNFYEIYDFYDKNECNECKFDPNHI